MSDGRKHKYGDGNVYQTATGEWRGRIALKDPATGKKMKPKIFYNGKSEAEIWRKIKAYKNDPLNYVGQSASEADAARYFRKWLDEYKKPRIKVSSYDRIDAVLRLYIEPELRGVQLRAVTADDCNDIIVKFKDKHLSYSTVKKIYDALNACFRFADDRHDVSENPMRTVEMPKKTQFATKRKDNESARNLTVEEEEAFLAELDRKTASIGKYVYRYRDAFILALNTGMRIGELIALDWSDIDFGKKTISVWKTAVMVKERDKDGEPVGKVTQIIQETPKTSKGNRAVPINKKAESALVRLKEQTGDSPFVFPTKTGARLVMNSLKKQYANVADHCAIEGTSFHSLRHTFATRLFEKGAEVKEVSTILGHSTVAITYNTYIHIIESHKANITGLLDD